jgi:hypothetical protein
VRSRPSRTRATPAPIAPWLRSWALLVVAAVASSAAAAGFVALDLDQRLRAADNAAVGVVSGVDVVVRDGEPWTLVTMEVERWWRAGGERVAGGDPAASALPRTLTVAFWGGRAPGTPPLQVAGVPAFTPGERVLWLVRAPDEGLAAPTVGVTQGVWRMLGGVWTGDDGSRLGVGDDGELALDGSAVPDELLFAALDAAFAALEEQP